MAKHAVSRVPQRAAPPAVIRVGPPRLVGAELGVPRIASQPRLEARTLLLAAPALRHPVAWTARHQRSSAKYKIGWGLIITMTLLACLADGVHVALFAWRTLAGG